MKINSELPICMLEQNLELNEIDFVLFHLYQQYPEYREYYKNLRKTHPERVMILDNSGYEFYVQGKELDVEKYVETIKDLRPNYYLLPDTLMDKNKTIESVTKFKWYYETDLYLNAYYSNPMAVVQGNTVQEMFDCMLYYHEKHYINIAIPFHNSFFKETYEMHTANEWRLLFGNLTDDMRYALGRIEFVRKAQLLLNRFKYVHILGSHHPYEKRYYGFNSMDTGYPVKCGIEGYELFKEPQKPDVLIDDFVDKDLSRQTKSLIYDNVMGFKNL